MNHAESRSLPLSDRQAAENALFPWGDVLVFPGRPVVVWAIAKVGCSTIKRWLLSHVDPEPQERWTPDVHRYIRPRHSIKLLADEERERTLRTALTVGFVREPISRLVSAYVDKFVIRDHDHLFDPAREMISVTGTRGLSFRQFVEIVCGTPDDHLDMHWRPQARWFDATRPRVILNVERVSGTLASLDAALGLKAGPAEKANSTAYTRSDGTFWGDTPSDVLKAREVRPGPASLVDSSLRSQILERFAADAAEYRRAVSTARPNFQDELSVVSQVG